MTGDKGGGVRFHWEVEHIDVLRVGTARRPEVYWGMVVVLARGMVVLLDWGGAGFVGGVSGVWRYTTVLKYVGDLFYFQWDVVCMYYDLLWTRSFL